MILLEKDFDESAPFKFYHYVYGSTPNRIWSDNLRELMACPEVRKMQVERERKRLMECVPDVVPAKTRRRM
jgi:hypothetical protein